MLARKIRQVLAAAGATAAVAAVTAAPADAGLLVASAPGCASPDSEQVFAPWLDYASYFLAPDGGFEGDASGWSLANDAAVAAANSSYEVSGDGSNALAIPNGSSATSPTVCVGLEHPTIRFFVRKTSGTGLTPSLNALRVEALVEDNLGVVSSLPVGVVGSTGSWQPTSQMLVTASLLPLLPGDHTPVAFNFTPQGGNWQIDDVYVDPTGSR
jgi:hypothetical protein